MDELERQLVELDLDIAKAKRYQGGQEDELESKTAAGQDTSAIEKALKKSKQDFKISKATRREIIERLLEVEANRLKEGRTVN